MKKEGSSNYCNTMMTSYSYDGSFDSRRVVCPFFVYPSHNCKLLRPRMILTRMEKLVVKEEREAVPSQHYRS